MDVESNKSVQGDETTSDDDTDTTERALSTNERCSICLEDITSSDKKKLKCGHCFHRSCITTAFQYHHGTAMCPECRTPFTLRFNDPEHAKSVRDRMEEIRQEREEEEMEEIARVEEDIQQDNDRFNDALLDLLTRIEVVFIDAADLLDDDEEIVQLRREVNECISSFYRD